MKTAASVLIVDDEPSIRLMFRTALESSGYETQEAGNGSAALERLAGWSPDVMLLDLKMPAMDGMETLRRLRDAGNNTPVVIVTAHGSIPDAVAAMKLGAVDFLPKPVTPDALRRVVADIVARHQKTDSTRRPWPRLATRAGRWRLLGSARVPGSSVPRRSRWPPRLSWS